MSEPIRIEVITTNDGLKKAVGLIEKTFLEFDACYYTQEGIDTFLGFVRDTANFKDATVLGAYDGDSLAGVLATDCEKGHIICFFVDGTYHRRGIGKSLFRRMLEDIKSSRITVNAAPYATEIYHRLGFADTDVTQSRNGIVYTPMAYEPEQGVKKMP